MMIIEYIPWRSRKVLHDASSHHHQELLQKTEQKRTQYLNMSIEEAKGCEEKSHQDMT